MITKKYVSYTVYGDIHKYLEILISNVVFLKANDFYVVIYCDKENVNLISSKLSDALVLDGSTFGIKNKMLWRLNPIFDTFSNSFFPRDADSLISEREIELMNLFLESNKSFHIIRDHVLHFMPIMGGLFGVKIEIYHLFTLKNVKNLLFNVDNVYNFDQLFLADYIYPLIAKHSLIHTSSYHYINEVFSKVNKVDNYCGKYANESVSKFDMVDDYVDIVNRRSIHYFLAKIFRYRWFLFFKKV